MLRARVARSLQMHSRSSSTKPRPPTLPRLPVPDLHQTLSRYLASLDPLLREDDAAGKHPYSSAYALRQKWADEFVSGIGHVLQDRLIALDKASPNNWLDDNFWINKAYLEWRAPLLVNSNWWLAFYDDHLIPLSALSGETNNNRAGTTFWQLRRSAWLVHRTLEYKARFDNEELEETTTRTGIWLHENTTKMFNIARVPELYCDVLSTPNPESPHHLAILVMLHGWSYAVQVYHPGQPPTLMSPAEIEKSLRAVVLDGEKAILVGALSADDRDIGLRLNLQYLLSISPTNGRTHQAHLHTALTLIVDPSTRSGATGEHSPVDALVPSIVAEYAVTQGVDVDAFNKSSSSTAKVKVSDTGNHLIDYSWERLDWVADDKVRKECKAAEQRALNIINDSDDSVLWFSEYGTDWIKNDVRFSPDAYIQMALQLAWYKTRRTFTATYETVLTRMFKRGRTETLRSLTTESREWVLSMVSPTSSNKTKHLLLQRALQKHTRLTREAATGRGIDRHLLGLCLLLRPFNGESSPLFEDELFDRSQEWKLSTSGLSAGHLFKGTGFGAAYDDGYGINYLAAPEMVKFGIESKFSNPATSTASLKAAIVESLHEMKAVCLAHQLETDVVHASL
ncbi:acyltransferase ChoActase/COT/CPT [Cyathus striatus]|nr:acyltransferase ChoActase/COT/CPT [Cyathus striatus]